jgi:hypothetical protein
MKNYGFFKTLTVISFITFFVSCQSFVEDALQDKEYTKKLKQSIGGNLICDVHFYTDFQEAVHIINYSYIDENGKIYKLGLGRYTEGWERQEQLLKYKSWIILPTSDSRESDKLIIGNLKENVWKEFIISPEEIEKNPIWSSRKINSSPGNYDSTSKIIKIKSNGEVKVQYKYALKNRMFNFMTGSREILYGINAGTGILEMKSISK